MSMFADRMAAFQAKRAAGHDECSVKNKRSVQTKLPLRQSQMEDSSGTLHVEDSDVDEQSQASRAWARDQMQFPDRQVDSTQDFNLVPGNDVIDLESEVASDVASQDDIPAGQQLAMKPEVSIAESAAAAAPSSSHLPKNSIDKTMVIDMCATAEQELMHAFEEGKIHAPPQANAQASADEGRDAELEAGQASDFVFAAQSVLGKRFSRYLQNTQEEKRLYDKMSRTQKEMARQKWARMHFDKYQRSRTHTTSTRERYSKIGQMLNFDAMVKADGGRHSPAVVQGCLNRAKACIARGVPWVEYDNDSKRLLFRYVRKEDRTDKDELWSDIRKEFNDAISRPTQPSPQHAPVAFTVTDESTSAPSNDMSETPPRQAKPAKATEAQGADKAESTVPATRKPAMQSPAQKSGLKRAASPSSFEIPTKTKTGKNVPADKVAQDYVTAFTTALQQCQNLLRLIDSDEENWGWAKTKHTQQPLQSAHDNLVKARDQDHFLTSLLTFGVHGVKSNCSQKNHFDKNVLRLVSSQSEVVGRAIQAADAAVQMHYCRLSNSGET